MRRSRAVLLPSISFRSTTSLIGILLTAACGGAAADKGTTTTPPDTTPTQTGPTIPAAPTGLLVSATSATSVTLTWTRNSSNETGFQVERSSGAGAFNLLATTAAGATAYGDTALAASTTDTYRVRAVGSAGTSAYTHVATLTTPAGCPAPIAITQDVAITTTWTAGTTAS